MVIQKTIKEIVILVGVAVGLAFGVNTLSPRGIALVGQWDTATGAISARVPVEDEYRVAEIDWLPDAKKIFDSGEALFVDARTKADYESGHIPGAVSLPVDQFDHRIESFLNRTPHDQPIIIYCSGRTCEDSHNLALLLTDSGFSDVRVLIDGFPGWEAEGYPIE